MAMEKQGYRAAVAIGGSVAVVTNQPSASLTGCVQNLTPGWDHCALFLSVSTYLVSSVVFNEPDEIHILT